MMKKTADNDGFILHGNAFSDISRGENSRKFAERRAFSVNVNTL